MKKRIASLFVAVGLVASGMTTGEGVSVAQADTAKEAGDPSSRSDVPLRTVQVDEVREQTNQLVRQGNCPDSMIEVEGDYCPSLEQKCIRWADPETKMRCAEFAPSGKCQTKTVKKHFCIDTFEYPNKVGAKPVIMKTWYEAKDACAAEGKRLCGDSEWTMACEGEEHLPYPYGHARNADACNIDKPHPDVNEAAIANVHTRDAEVARLDQRASSGEFASCVSPYGVHDMTGNVDEWVVNEGGAPFKSGLKGGYWGPVRTRCRPMTTAHNESFAFYQIGFRCCADAGKQEAKPGAGMIVKAKTAPVPATKTPAASTFASK
jgi:hypothetical protein